MKTSKLYLQIQLSNRKDIVMSESRKMTKREFLTQLVTVTGASVVAAQMLASNAFAQEKRRGAKKEEPKGDAKAGKGTDLPMVEPGKGMAASLAYHHTHADAEKDPKTDKTTDKGTPWKDQQCSTCSFFKATGKKKDMEVGTCTLFKDQLVASKGICNSWAKK